MSGLIAAIGRVEALLASIASAVLFAVMAIVASDVAMREQALVSHRADSASA